MKTIDALFEPFALKGNIVLKNRFVLSPMVTNFFNGRRAYYEKMIYYMQRDVLVSAALQITGAAYVNKQGQLFEFGLVRWMNLTIQD